MRHFWRYEIVKSESWTIFGAGDLICDIIDAIESRGGRATQLVCNMELARKTIDKLPNGIKVIDLTNFKPSGEACFFGFSDPNKAPFLQLLKPYNLQFSNLVHTFSYVPASVEMGQGNFIGAGAVLATKVRLGNFNYINRMASLGHDTEIADFNQIGPGCTIASNCKIGNRNNISTNSAVITGRSVDDDITVGAGAVVVRDIRESGTYVGVPAHKLA